ncbi:MAG: M56 family metallopeptidase [Waltera sp.]
MSRIFSGVLQMSIAAAWMIPVVMVLRRLLKRAPKWVNLVLWGLVGLRLVCPFVPESRFSLMPKLPILSGYLYGNMIGSPAGNAFRADTLQNGTNFSDNISQAALDGSMGAAGSGMGGAFGITGSGIGAFGAGVWRIPERLLSAFSILWLAGVILFAGYAVYSYVRVRRQVAEAMWLRENLWICDEVKSPYPGTACLKIYLSSSMDEAQYPYVIAHEQAHLKRGDQWWKPLGFLILAIHWFNPFVWAAYILFCSDLELACDESAVKKLNPQERKDYSYALLSCSMQRRLVTVCPLAFGEVGVKKRVKEILNYKKPTFWVVLAAVAVCVIVAVCFLTNPKQGTTTTILLTNETGKSENGVDAGNVASADEVNAQQETDAALQEALDKQRERAEAVKEASAAEQEKQAAENPAGWIPMQNGNTTTWMNMQDGATAGFVTGKGDAAYAQVKLGDTTLLLLSDGIYQDGEHTYAMYCDVYGVGEDGTPVQIGELLSEGTAYPICVGMSGFYVTSGHSIEVYNLDTATGQLVLTGSNTESFDENGNETYYRLDSRGQSVESTAEEYLQAWDAYGKDAQPIEFTTP